MKRVVLVIIAMMCAIVLGLPVQAFAITKPELLISEVSAGSATNSREEFIELYNSSERLIDFNKENWSVQIASSSATNWKTPIRTIKLTGYVYPGIQYLIGTTFNQTESNESVAYRYPEAADSYYASALTASAGHVRVIEDRGIEGQTVHDELEWVAKPEASIDHRLAFITVKALAAGTSLTRRAVENVLQDSDNDAIDFEIQTTITPQSTTADQPALPVEEVPIVTDPEIIDGPGEALLPITITELLPNPATPLSDTSDEYIELHNPNDTEIDITGYILQTGLTTFRKYTIPADTTIPGNGYLALYSSQTKLSLINSGSKVALYGPNGTDLIVETEPYGTAEQGLVWQYVNGLWQWSSSQTPSALNLQTLPIAALTKTATTKMTTKKVTATKKVTTKPKAVKQTKAKTTKAKKAKDIKTVKTAMVAETKPKQAAIHSALLAAVLVIALLYGAYEYRHELYRQFKRLGRNRADRPAHRLSAAGSGTDPVSK